VVYLEGRRRVIGDMVAVSWLWFGCGGCGEVVEVVVGFGWWPIQGWAVRGTLALSQW
jgi:hypothetical protein